MGARERNKGAGGEREFARAVQGRRTGFHQSQASSGSADVGMSKLLDDRFHVEIKRQETIKIHEWTKQAEADAPEDKIPLVAYRRNRDRWRVVIPLDDFLDLLAQKP